MHCQQRAPLAAPMALVNAQQFLFLGVHWAPLMSKDLYKAILVWNTCGVLH